MQRKRTTRWIVGGALAVAVIGGGTGMALANGAGDDEKPITGPALRSASDAALRHTGGGRVTETEIGDEEGFYEVEVTRADGSQVDVHLDRNFKVLGTKADQDSPGDQDGNGGR
jgi:hypothetical protein